MFVRHVVEGVEAAAVEELEAHQGDVHGVSVFGLVDELPYLGGVEFWSFGDGLVPALAVEEHDHRVGDPVLVLVERDGASDGGGGLGGSLNGAKSFGDCDRCG